MTLNQLSYIEFSLIVPPLQCIMFVGRNGLLSWNPVAHAVHTSKYGKLDTVHEIYAKTTLPLGFS